MNNVSRESSATQSFKCPYCHHSYCDRTHVDNCDRRMVGCPFCFHKFTSRLINTHIHSCSENKTNPSRGNGTTPGQQFPRGSPGSRPFRNRNREKEQEAAQVFTPERFDERDEEELVEVPRITPMITKQKKTGKKASSNRKKTAPIGKKTQQIPTVNLEEAEGFSPDIQDMTPLSEPIRTVNMFGPTSNIFEEEKRGGHGGSNSSHTPQASAQRGPFDLFPGPFRGVTSPTQHQHQPVGQAQILGNHHHPHLHPHGHGHQHQHAHQHPHHHGHLPHHHHHHLGGGLQHHQPGGHMTQMPHRIPGNTSTTISLPGTTISITCPVMSNITYTTSDGGYHREMRIIDGNGGHFTQTSIIGGGGAPVREDPCPFDPNTMSQVHRQMDGIFQQAMSNVMQMIPFAMGGPALDMGMTRRPGGNDIFGMLMNATMPVFTFDYEVAGAGANNENRGLDHEEINSIPLSKFKATRREQTNTQTSDKSCSVCINDFLRGDTLRTLPCTHKFHKDCIDPWLTNNGSCPICRERCS